LKLEATPTLYDSQHIPSTDDESPVVFRQIKPLTINRKLIPRYLSHQQNHADTTFFYVTSSVVDDNSKSYTSSDQQPSLSVNNFSMTFFSFLSLSLSLSVLLSIEQKMYV
jgi:hypothetical protein